MKGLMDISNKMQQISSHKCSLKGYALFVSLKHSVAPINCVDCIYILLQLCHALETEIWIIDTK